MAEFLWTQRQRTICGVRSRRNCGAILVINNSNKGNKMNLQLLIPLQITSCLTLVSWFIIHLFAIQRDKKISKRNCG